ncbi:MAG TPA: ABC transporter permease [Noviherbaspirillum sp.]|jgi:phospholipid/cholesterol/gamma-HCH transport system permease protein|uniref:MlaE family ABC transporter permease n=1 Tax=Noviherbaspirillum sp. TaxID=1926288 RepID=UPI002DDDB63E|nr:ABC transporter permease [Noviherbaspirillum sp.]HEV2610252.1 ABC transporter permease [Noviherbaspirillum sp.]
MPNQQLPTLTIENGATLTVSAEGAWQVQGLARPSSAAAIRRTMERLPAGKPVRWDLTRLTALDHIGAQWLWNAWRKQRPMQLDVLPQHAEFFNRIEQAGALALPEPKRRPWFSLLTLARVLRVVNGHLIGFISLIGQLVLDLGRFARRPLRGPWKEISSNIFHIGYQALGITAIVGFLIGVVLSYLSAQQLHTFGGDIYLVNILGMSIVRELGPLLAAILVAGRSGSAITAQLGVMRVTEELDAMLVMGMSHGFRLIMPRVLALAISMPLLVVWTDAVALLGGMTAAQLELGLSPTYFLNELPEAVPLANYWIGLGKGVVFGSLIALVACHFGLRIKPNTESLGQGTTQSVVVAITVVILADAVFAIVFRGVGFY